MNEEWVRDHEFALSQRIYLDLGRTSTVVLPHYTHRAMNSYAERFVGNQPTYRPHHMSAPCQSISFTRPGSTSC
jgi:hypothetical protein